MRVGPLWNLKGSAPEISQDQSFLQYLCESTFYPIQFLGIELS